MLPQYGAETRARRLTFGKKMLKDGGKKTLAKIDVVCDNSKCDGVAYGKPCNCDPERNRSLDNAIAKARLKKEALERKGDLAGILTNLGPRDVLFIDEIHRLNAAIEENLYPAMEDFEFDLIIGEGSYARNMKIQLPPFTLIGATTRTGLLTSPMRDRFGIIHRLNYYTAPELETIVHRSAKILEIPLDDGGAEAIARRSRGTPRVANRLLRRVRDFAEVEGEGHIDSAMANHALERMQVDNEGLDPLDRSYLATLIDKFSGGPVGVETMSAALSEEKTTLEDVFEPYLMQEGFIQRTPRGRTATAKAYQHLGRELPKGFQNSLL